MNVTIITAGWSRVWLRFLLRCNSPLRYVLPSSVVGPFRKELEYAHGASAWQEACSGALTRFIPTLVGQSFMNPHRNSDRTSRVQHTGSSRLLVAQALGNSPEKRVLVCLEVLSCGGLQTRLTPGTQEPWRNGFRWGIRQRVQSVPSISRRTLEWLPFRI